MEKAKKLEKIYYLNMKMYFQFNEKNSIVMKSIFNERSFIAKGWKYCLSSFANFNLQKASTYSPA